MNERDLEQWLSIDELLFRQRAHCVPRRRVTINDAAAYGAIVVQGVGSVGKLEWRLRP